MRHRLSFAATLIAFAICSCSTQEVSRPVTILVTQGFSEQYFRSLADDVRKDLGIEIEFLYKSSASSSTLLLQDFANDNLQSDIIFTYAKLSDKYLQGSCLDFASESNLLSHYSYTTTKEFMTDDGSVYELPLSSRIVGITYNATLMEEKGWEMPRTYEDMLNLKRKCEKDGIPFAITDMKYSGHPFNYLFNIMGVQWLSSPTGKTWFDGFMVGNKTMHVFKTKSDYFRRWTEDGLFGELADLGSPAVRQFQQRRALFCFANRNMTSGYCGPEYDKNGNPTGRMLNDVHKSMPWISEDGSNNCFTLLNNCMVMVNGDLARKENEKILRDVISVIEYMMGEKYIQMALNESPDVYLQYDKVEYDESRLFFDYLDNIEKGFTQPWYYNYFDDPTIITTGGEIASYIVNVYKIKGWDDGNILHINYDLNPNANFDTAIGMLSNSLHAMAEDYLGWAEEDIAPAKVAELTAICGGLSLQELIDSREVTVGLMPYATDIREMQPWIPAAVQNANMKAGVLQKAYSYILEPAGCTHVVGILMSGRQINEIVARQYDPSAYFTDISTGVSSFDKEHYGPYPYACVTKNGMELKDNVEYLVAVSPNCLEKDVYESFERSGKIITDGKNVISANLGHGSVLFFRKQQSITNDNIVWE